MPTNLSALERAFGRGDAASARLGNRADMLTGEQVAARLGVSRASIDYQRVAGQMLAVDLGIEQGFRYPDWQVELISDPARRVDFEQALLALGAGDAWSKYRFFMQPAPALGRRTPVTALRVGEGAAVAAAAVTWASGGQGGG